MKLSYDSAKNGSNIQKHGLSLAKASLLEWDTALEWIDGRKNYGEERRIALVLMKQRLYCIVYIELKVGIRVISLRKANVREVEKYEKENN
ncbi:BrnT family toxin [Polynucleobacter sp. MG-Unter2-18]|uniref:BrnT family toxin n=1 Tax=Polynucleobacter sp. MG-Unter2-18 TaxID=2081052 RepID=UPI001BFD6856|nr:BrnT family toxin [Polynucleobacter sp. MG-Unter2-18]MCF8190063.1 BrnT family toxin [Polynucleobacter sp.]QWD93787.1 BrnT family toxin [Polynucleobacter sp. MG-Unter2-18]